MQNRDWYNSLKKSTLTPPKLGIWNCLEFTLY